MFQNTKKKRAVITKNAKLQLEEISKMDPKEVHKIVFDKVIKLINRINCQTIDPDIYADRLYKDEEIRDFFLSMKKDELLKYFNVEKTKKKKSTFLTSKVESLEYVESPIDSDVKEEEEEEIEDFELITTLNEPLKIKLVITNTSHTDSEQKQVQLMSPLASFLNLSGEFGMVIYNFSHLVSHCCNYWTVRICH